MTDLVTITGIVGGDPRPFTTTQGLTITTFRLASTRRYFDRAAGSWENGETNWYTVSAFRALADNVAFSIRRGQHVVVHGRLKLRAWQAGEKSGTAVEIEAEAIGHDLTWGVTTLRRMESANRPAGDAGAGEAAGDAGSAPAQAEASTDGGSFESATLGGDGFDGELFEAETEAEAGAETEAGAEVDREDPDRPDGGEDGDGEDSAGGTVDTVFDPFALVRAGR